MHGSVLLSVHAHNTELSVVCLTGDVPVLGIPLSEKRLSIRRCGGSGVSKKRHKSEVHVTLIVAMKEGGAGIVRSEVHFGGCV